MTELPSRSTVLACGLVTAVGAALLFNMAAAEVVPPYTTNPSAAAVLLVIALLAIRYNWARITAAVLLALAGVLSLPAIVAVGAEDASRQLEAIYVLSATVLAVAAEILLFHPTSTAYYRDAARWRARRRHRQAR